MAEQDINHTILETLRGVAYEFGKMTSPTAGVDTKGTSKKGKKYEGFTFGISARMDGEVKVFGKNFILIMNKRINEYILFTYKTRHSCRNAL